MCGSEFCSAGVSTRRRLALLRERASGFATFSVGFSGNNGMDERSEAARAARELGADHHEIEVSQADAIRFLAELIRQIRTNRLRIPFVSRSASYASLPTTLV